MAPVTPLLVLAVFLLYIQPSSQIRYCGKVGADLEYWNGYCYFFSYPTGTYSRAKEVCEGMGAVIVSVHSEEEAQYIHDSMEPTTYYNYWIGLEKDSDGTFKWADGTDFDFDKWGVGEPGSDPYECTRARISNLEWHDSSCYSSSEYVCKAEAVDGWQEYDNNEYFMSTSPDEIDSTWYEARAWCMDRGADLVSVLSIDEATQVAKWAALNHYNGPLWIGLNDLQRRDAWGWSDGSAFSSSWSNWEKNYPSNELFGFLCGFQMSESTEGKWLNGHCDTKKGFICKRPKTAVSPTPKPTKPTPVISGYCPTGFTGVGNKCFKVVISRHNLEPALSFEEAIVKCSQEPGFFPTLASISSDLEQAYITAHLQRLGIGVWIGLHYLVNDEAWVWVDSSSFSYNNWASEKPSDRNGKYCAEIWMVLGSVGKWNNVNCNDKRSYVCQTYKDPGNIILTSAPPSHNFSCSAGFTAYWYGCFRYQPEAMTYERAKAGCAGLSPRAQLAGIHAAAENAAVQTWAITHDSQPWIGFKDDGDEANTGEYKWEDGWVVFFVNWARGQPAKDPGGGCVSIAQDGKWSDTNCQTEKPSVCKISNIPPITTPATIAGQCPSGDEWFEYHEHCYLLVPTGYTTWAEAKNLCQGKALFSSLASVHSLIENRMILDKLKEMGSGSTNVWLGLYRSTVDRSKMKWTDMSSLQFEAWAPSEPNGGLDDREDCVQMINEHWPGLWNDHNCNSREGYVCKASKLLPSRIPTMEPQCEAGWAYWVGNRHCYHFQPDNLMPFPNAEEYCAERDAHVVSIHGILENAHVERKMKAVSNLPMTSNIHYWVGLQAFEAENADTFIFSWTDGSEHDYSHWSRNEPINPMFYRCVELDQIGGQWATAKCENNLGFACKKASKKSNRADTDGNGLSGGEVAGVVIGVLLGVVLLVCCVLVLLTQREVIENPVTRFTASGFFSRSQREGQSQGSPGGDPTVNYRKQP